MREYCKILEVAGIKSAILGMRLPTKSVGDSCGEVLGEKDEKLASSLIKKGSVHGKFQRGIIAWLDINMPRYMWSEIDTYMIGRCDTSSESTMYTLVKECAVVKPEMFSTSTLGITIERFIGEVELLGNIHNGRKNIPIQNIKAILPEGWMQRRIRGYSYQALRSMYYYRKNHRLPEWQIICNCIESLPYFEELILGCPKDEFKCEGD